MKKLTRKDKFNMIIEALYEVESQDMGDLIDFCRHEIELIDKNSSKKSLLDLDELKLTILSILRGESGYMLGVQILEEVKNTTNDDTLTQPKITSRLTVLIKEGLVEKKSTRVKGKNLMTYKAVN